MVESEGSYSAYSKSQNVSGTESTVSSQTENRGRLESKKKLKKVRSIRLVRLSSMRSSTRGGKPQHDNLSMADASPSYMKATTSSHAKDNFESTQGPFTKKALTRMSSLKLKRSVTRKLSGRTEPKRKLKLSKSIKFATVKGLKSSKKLSESVCDSASDAGNKSQRVITRRLSLKPVRILTKMPTFKSKNFSMEKGPCISQSTDSTLHKATCSSTLKNSHFPDRIDLPQEGAGSQGVTNMKVCPYTYCSLHGHRHGNVPPLKHFVSMRRRVLKSQKTVKMDGQPVTRSKQFGNTRKASKKTQIVNSKDGISNSQGVKKMASDSRIRPHHAPASTDTEGGSSGREDKENYNSRYNAEVLLGETSFPHTINFEEHLGNSLSVKGYTSQPVKETTTECCCIATEKDKLDYDVTVTAGNDKNVDVVASKRSDESDAVESTSADAVRSSASDIEILQGEATAKGKNTEPDPEVLQMSSIQKESTAASTADAPYEMQEKDQKYVKMWRLMYKHAVLSDTRKCENKLPADGKNKEGRGQDDLTLNRVNSSSSCGTDTDTDDVNQNVIELVRKAVEEILLPESEDLSSDDSFKSRGVADEVLSEKSEGKTEERNISTSTESPKEAQRIGTKSDQRTPKSWSNLKKIILLKRFVKALEKVRNFNPRRPRHLLADANLESEKVYLKHEATEERKNAEEWMLDYALQKVISKLAPAQRQRVTLLVEAFETILPFKDAENGPQSSSTVEPQAYQIQSFEDSSDDSKDETDKERDHGDSAKILHGNASFSHNSTMDFADNAVDNPMPELQNPVLFKERSLDCPGTKRIMNMPASGEIKDSRSSSMSTPAELISSCQEEAPTNDKDNEVPEDSISNLNIEHPDIKSESPGRDVKTENPIGDNREQFSVSKNLILKGLVRSLRSNSDGPEAPANLSGEPTEDRKERIEKATLETRTLEEFPTREQCKAPTSAVVEPETKQDKQRYTGLWYLVYKHMVSDTAESNSSSKSLLDGADDKESGYEGSRTRETSISHETAPAINQDMNFEDHAAADPEVELQKIEAIKMVEEAIDSILPDVQDHLPERQSHTGNTISDNSKQSYSAERVSSECMDQKEERMESGNGITPKEEEEKSAPKEGSKTNQQLPRSWSNLKKVILLRRFIKALDKVRKFNPRGPRFLPIEPDPEAEKVNLRHQDTEERKGTEEWMLDYALRQVVSKLTPARKRKVELLVEAFETVMPTTKN